jgi:peptide/nickel transport system substrate-binding protein
VTGELLWKLFRGGVVAAIGVLLAVSIYQADAVERRLLRLDEALREVERKVDALASRPVVAAETGKGGGDRADPTAAADASDPRTLVYWPTPDNILVPPDREPAPPLDAPRGGTLHYYTMSNPRTLNRYVNNEAELVERICAPVLEYLAPRSYADPDRFVPGLANRVTISDDRRTITCYVRKGVYWHTPHLTDAERSGPLRWLAEMPPQEATAHDVKFTIDTIRDPLAEAGAAATYFVDLDAVEVVDDYTVRFRWKIPSYYNVANTLYLAFILPKFIYEREQSGALLSPDQVAPSFPQHWFNQKLLGTGPFRFAGFVPNQYVLLERNDRWWNPRKPALDAIRIRIQQDHDVLLAMFKKGEIDVYQAQPHQYRAEILEKGAVSQMVERGEVSVTIWERFAYFYVGWNLRHPVLRHREVRRALAHLYPKERVIRDLYYGLAKPHDGPVHPWESSYVKDLERFDFDPMRAAQLLDAAGWRLNARGVREKSVDGETREIAIRLLYPSQSAVARDSVQLFAKAAQEAGVVFEPQPREWSVMTKLLEDKEFDACVLGWANSWDSDPTQIWHSLAVQLPKSSNHVSYRNPDVDATIEALKLEFDLEKRRALWERFQRTIVADQPYCFTLVRTDAFFVHNRLGNQVFQKLRPQDWFLPWFVKRP